MIVGGATPTRVHLIASDRPALPAGAEPAPVLPFSVTVYWVPAFSAYVPSESQTLQALGEHDVFWQTDRLIEPLAKATVWISGLPLFVVLQLVV